MKINPVLAIIAFAIAALAAYGFYAGNSGETYQIALSAGGGLSLFVTLGGLLAVSAGGRGGVVHVKALSAVFLIALLIEHVVFTFAMRLAPYIIVTGILLLVYTLLCYAVARTGE